MVGVKKEINLFGKNISVTELNITKRTNEPATSEYELEDGSIIRVNTFISSVVKFNDVTEPMYLVYPSPAVSVIKPPSESSPESSPEK